MNSSEKGNKPDSMEWSRRGGSMGSAKAAVAKINQSTPPR